MFSHLSASLNETLPDYPITDSNLPFADYIARTRKIIEERRLDLLDENSHPQKIISANSPYELIPSNPILSGKRYKYGALLIHGLLDSPFSLRDIGNHLQNHGILSRSILLPGHGTNPADLLHVSYHDWIQAVRYGVESLRKEVEHIYLIGYSTGATLSIYQAQHDNQIAGIILLSPAIRIKAPIDFVVAWNRFSTWFMHNKPWLYLGKEVDYVKYQSITFNAVNQVSQLTKTIRDILQQRSFLTPMYMVISREDETVSSHRAIDFFSSLRNSESKMLLYTSYDHLYPDQRIMTRLTNYPDLNIKHLSHICIPFSPTNPHYGQEGDSYNASRINKKIVYGAYNRIERRTYEIMNQLKLLKYQYKELTYNPDFDAMATDIEQFILGR
ncbi:MAG: hypothetical protein ACD_46C00682G0001 [uncultured bacterium]|nr:MAG: hypothetical protein ACD_46C00682G0001 [uncultured bacterium]